MTGIRRFSRAGLLALVLLPAGLAVVSTASANHSPPLLERISTGPTGGNGAFGATFAGASVDGTRAFFETGEALVAADGDTSRDVYERFGTTTTLVSDRVQAGADGADSAAFRGASRDGTRVFFETTEALVAADGDTSVDVYERSGGTTTLLSDRIQSGTDAEAFAFFGGASADGTRVFFVADEPLVSADGDSRRDVYERSGGTTTLLSDRVQAGADADAGANFGGASADGTIVFFEAGEPLLAADGDSFQDVYQRSGGATTIVSDRAQAGADAALSSFFTGNSQDGTRVFFQSAEPIVTSDGDSNHDIYERSGGTSKLVSDRVQAGTDAAVDSLPVGPSGVSQDGTRVFFRTNEPILATDGDSSQDVYERSGGTTTLVSDRVQAGTDAETFAFFGGASADGTRVFFLTNEPLLATDGDSSHDVYERSGGTTTLVSDRVQAGTDSADGGSFYGASADGTRVFFMTAEQLVSTDADATGDVYERARGITTLISVGPDTPSGSVGFFGSLANPVSEDGKRVFFTTTESLLSADTDTSSDVYMARAPTGYPRPRAATPLRVPLVTAYTECTAANRAHEAPFAAPSCDPPIQTSQFLTVGTADANGQASNSAGFVVMTVRPGNASTTQDEADIDLVVQLTDVRNQRDLSDYAGELQANFNLRITDRRNGATLAEPGTVAELPFPFTVVCTTTPADNTVGSTCAAATSADAVLAGAIKETKRTIMKVNDVRVFDGGPDGDAETPGNTLFAEGGLFVP